MNRTTCLSITLLGTVSILATTLSSCTGGGQPIGDTADMPFVAVTQTVELPALDAVRSGIEDELAAAGYEAGKTLRWEWRSAGGSPATARQIANKYVAASPDVIVAIAPPSAKSVASATNNIPIVFSAVSDPVDAELVTDIDEPGGNISGLSDRPPVGQQLALIKEILPEATTLGIVYSASESSPPSLISLVNENAVEQNLGIRAVTVSAAEEVTTAVESLIGLVDAIYVPTDDAVSSVVESVTLVGRENQVPVFAGEMDAVSRGAIATVGFDYYDMGRQTGEMVVEVLGGSRPGDLSVEFVEDSQLAINPAAAAAMGVVLPNSVVSRADEVVE
ncbi:MAG: ABC transporter substrate-binding protein [Cyanobacteria bacterium P01_D01_bin.1]